MHDLYEHIDGEHPEPHVSLADDAPEWGERDVILEYGGVTYWYGAVNGALAGASIITTETGKATWPDGATTDVTRPHAVDVYATTNADVGILELFKAVHIDAHPEQSWKLVAELEIGDRIVELTFEALGLNDADLPAVVDRIGPEVNGRRAMHYTAVQARPGRTIAQGASHNPLALQWVRLADDEAGEVTGDGDDR